MTRVRRRPGNRVEVQLSTRERDLLRSLPEQLRPVLSGEYDMPGGLPPTLAAIRARLFPPAYDDERADAEYRDLVGEALVEERLAKLDAFAHTLDAGTVRGRSWRIELDDEAAHAWLSATNDARLVLAAVVGITSEDAWERGPDPADPASVALWYLGWLQEALLEALTGSLGG